MVRINLITPVNLADQHLIAEYDEILMLLGYVKKYPKKENIPENYCLGKGHIRFFKNKLLYLKKRHELIKKEMRKRGFKTNITIELKKFDASLINDWVPEKKDFDIIKKRIIEKIKLKPDYYKYYGEKKKPELLIKLIRKQTSG
jgi:deoxyribonuclease (pyrimidine dimer)